MKSYEDQVQKFTPIDIDIASLKPRQVFGVQVFGFFITICLSFIGFSFGIIFVGFLMALGARLFPEVSKPNVIIPVGIILCLFFISIASPLFRRFCYFLKYLYLREAGIVVDATVVGRRQSIPPRGPEQIDLIVAWQDPVTGQTYIYERHYTFFWELFSQKKTDLFDSYYSGAYVSLIFHPARPRQFILLIPFVPCWYDVLF
ncbi:MAG: hypothetical protein ACJ795_10960 [Ktedonobacteraceae bacterium]